MKKDSVYLHHILDSIEKIETYSRVGRETFMSTSHWQDAIIRNLEIIGEAVKRLSEDFKSNNPEIIWRDIAGLRDILIHQYMGVDLNTVWNVIENNLPELKQVILNNLKS
ncbi:MAG: DUF86 domain-containing protein [Proteobacteria bacterium]|nr:DUF86 domain-containing protein [Pseudomonadota bacterium]MBU1709541.1 DUF86 domain-containing protein [Pseudomonadota bacterium]